MWCRGALFRPPGTLHPQKGKPFAVVVDIDQREAGAQPVVVLFQAPVSHLVEVEDALQDPERMFHLRSNSGLGRVLACCFPNYVAHFCAHYLA